MKLFLLSNLFCAVYLMHSFWEPASSQYYEDPTLFFKPFEFDSILRGQYNVSNCILDLLNCWEMIRPDVMCDTKHRGRYDFETMCAINKYYCHDVLGDYDAYWNRYIAFTGYCRGAWMDWYDKGKWT